jgi:hypothetical protein
MHVGDGICRFERSGMRREGLISGEGFLRSRVWDWIDSWLVGEREVAERRRRRRAVRKSDLGLIIFEFETRFFRT